MLADLGLCDLVGVNHHRSALALANVAAEFERLLERHPDRRREAASDGFRPEQHDIDALIGHAVMAQRARDASSRVGRIPGLDPRTHTALEIRDDAIGDPRIDVGAGFRFLTCHDPNLRWRPRPSRPVTAVRCEGLRGRASGGAGGRSDVRDAGPERQWRTAKPLRCRAGRSIDRKPVRARDGAPYRFISLSSFAPSRRATRKRAGPGGPADVGS
jgi:hypothetical protein